MNGELAQLIALASYGTRWLRSTGPGPDLLKANSAFQYVRSLAFEYDPRKRLKRSVIANSTESWFQALRARDVTGIWLDTRSASVVQSGEALPPHLAAAFAGGGTWSLVCQGEGDAEIWRGHWSVITTPRPPDNRIWDVRYTGFPTAPRSRRIAEAAPSSRERLHAVLSEIERFARAQDLMNWAEWFADARSLGDSSDPHPPYHDDLLPAGSPLSRRQLMAMAVRAWVFGGMGSWNDVWLNDRDQHGRYEQLTQQLHAAVLDALEDATNDEPS